jgi:hypothetical protein
VNHPQNKIKTRILNWIFENPVKAILFLFSIVLISASVIPQGGGGGFSWGSGDGSNDYGPDIENEERNYNSCSDSLDTIKNKSKPYKNL